MYVATLKAKIKSKQLPSYIIFSGEEWKVQEIYIKQIAKATNKEIIRIDSITDIYSQLQNRSFIQAGFIYIVRDDKELMQNEKLQQNIESVLGDNILLHLLTSIDKRTKFYKQYKDTIIEFEALNDAILKKYIKKEINLSDKNCQTLIDICEHSYGRILLEIDKIRRYALLVYPEVGHEEENGDYNRALEELVKDGTIYEPPYDAIFDLVNAILDRNVNKAFDLLQQSYAVGEATMVMLSVLYNNAKAVLQIQTYKGNDLSKATGLTGWQIKNGKPYVGKYSDEELIYIVKLIQKIESGIKTGKMEDEFAMQYLLTHVL
jgi:DNA polymerase III delta subunit